MENLPSYSCKCENCKRDLWDMINAQPVSHLMLESTIKHELAYIQEHKRYCDLLCLKQWVVKSLPIET